MSRDILEAAKRLKDATPEEIQLIAKHDWDMIREVAATCAAYMPKPKVEVRHHADCELRGGEPCMCKQDMPEEYYL